MINKSTSLLQDSTTGKLIGHDAKLLVVLSKCRKDKHHPISSIQRLYGKELTFFLIETQPSSQNYLEASMFTVYVYDNSL